MSRLPIKGWTFALLATFTWGGYLSLAKIVLEKITVEHFLVLRFFIGAAVLFGIIILTRDSLVIKRVQWWAVIFTATIGIILHQSIQATGLRFTTATNTGWILTFIPVVTGLLAYWFLHEPIRLKQVIGLIIAGVGLITLITNGDVLHLFSSYHYGDYLIMGSVVTWSIYTVSTKKYLSGYSALVVSMYQMLLGGIFFLALSGSTLMVDVIHLSNLEWCYVVLAGAFASGLAYVWWNSAAKLLDSLTTSMFMFFESIVAMVVGFLLLGEHISVVQLLGIGVIILGVCVAIIKPKESMVTK
ncbi:MAG: DMT family transporter [Patescibacteria group bacterium]|jgi:drug/metabolite transporter (DMT)-like permease